MTEQVLGPREKCPLGTIRIRRHNGLRARFIKVRDSGPPRTHWKMYAAWVWEERHGPIPLGKRVIHKDGDTLNDDPGNLAAVTADEVFAYAARRDPTMLERNRRNQPAGTAAWNRQRAQLRRSLEILASRWYPVDPQRKVIINRPCKKYCQVYGIKVERGNGFDCWSRILGWPGLSRSEACILAVLADAGGELRSDELRRRVAAFRYLRSFWPACPSRGEIATRGVSLRRLGYVVTTRPRVDDSYGRWRITEAAIAARIEVSPFVAVRGDRLLADELFDDYRREDP